MASRGKRWRRGITATAVVLAALAAVWALRPIQEALCKTQLFQAAGQPGCGIEFRKVSVEEANRALSNYLGRAAGAEKQNAWAMLFRSEEIPQPPQWWLKDWTDIAFAERIGDAKPEDGYNRFYLTYRTYSKPAGGKVTVRDWDQSFVIWHQPEDSYTLDPRDNRANPKQTSKGFPVAVVTQPVAWRNSPVNGTEFGKTRVGEHHFIYCELPVAGEVWARTEVGFIPTGDIEVSKSGVDAPDECDAHFAKDALGRS